MSDALPVGLVDSLEEGKELGELDGWYDGADDGCELGPIVGINEGLLDDLIVGGEEGTSVGE